MTAHVVPLALLLAACVHRVPPEVAPPPPDVRPFSLVRKGKGLQGLAYVDLTAEPVRIQALTPVGVELFQVTASPTETTVQAPDERWRDLLMKIPFRRDFLLCLSWSCPEGRCAVEGGRLREHVEGDVRIRTWRGPGGPATVRIEGPRAVLTDPLRGYELTLLLSPPTESPHGP